MKNFLFLALFFLTLTSCSKPAPKAWLFEDGMTKEDVIKVLNDHSISYDDNGDDIHIDEEIDFLEELWQSASINFDNDKILTVSFYYPSESPISKWAIKSRLDKELGVGSVHVFGLESWSKKDEDWLVTFADNEPPFPQTLVYWYSDSDKESDKEKDSNETESDDSEEIIEEEVIEE